MVEGFEFSRISFTVHACIPKPWSVLQKFESIVYGTTPLGHRADGFKIPFLFRADTLMPAMSPSNSPARSSGISVGKPSFDSITGAELVVVATHVHVIKDKIGADNNAIIISRKIRILHSATVILFVQF